jgi:hypothetical protein
MDASIHKSYADFGAIFSAQVDWFGAQDAHRASIKEVRIHSWMLMLARFSQELIGLELKIGWGKALPRPSVPCYVHSPEVWIPLFPKP